MYSQQITVLVAVAALLGSIALLALNETPVIEPGRPGTATSAPATLVASVAPIGDFEREFHVNYENPFVPYNERVADRVAQDPAEKKNRPVRPPMRPTPPPETPPVMVEPARLVLPARRDPPPGAPECIGIVRHGPSGQARLMVRLPGEIAAPLAVGEVIGGWTLKEIGAGVARFERPDGGEDILPVGAPSEGASLPVKAPATPAPTPTTPDTGIPMSPMTPRSAGTPTRTPQIPTPVPAGDPRMR